MSQFLVALGNGNRILRASFINLSKGVKIFLDVSLFRRRKVYGWYESLSAIKFVPTFGIAAL